MQNYGFYLTLQVYELAWELSVSEWFKMFSSFYDTIPLWRWCNKTMMKIQQIILMKVLLMKENLTGAKGHRSGF